MMPPQSAIAAASGLFMAAAALPGAPTLALPLVEAAALLALAGLRFRHAATAAVLTIIGALAVSNPTALLAVAAGIAAAVYLLSVHAIDQPPGVVPLTPSALGGALGFGVAALLVAVVPGGHPWWPVIAPVTVVILYLLAVRPLRRH
jgi:hypothetical protein